MTRKTAVLALLLALAPGPALRATAEEPQAAAGPKAAGEHHLIYLHGRIIQDQQDRRPKHPEWGYYELDRILATLRARGFSVTSEVRPKDASLGNSADRVVEQYRALVAAGIPRSQITVVGGSMGAAIGLLAAVKLQEPQLRLAALGACMSLTVPLLVQDHGRGPMGRVLAFLEKSDETSEPCPAWRSGPGSPPGLEVREVRLDTGQRHGFLYRPLPQWVDPLVEWATQH